MTDRVALVTGASSDIGAAISHRLAEAGAHVIASGRNLKKLVRIAANHGSKIDIVAADLTNPGDVEAVRESVSQRERLDVLVLGSGIYLRSNDPEAFTHQLAANVQGPYALLEAVLPLLIAAKGLVIFINSTQGLAASPGVGQFAATQHAMRALANSVREEVHSRGVRVTSLFLGRTATARQKAIFAMERRHYAPELLVQPADVANVVAHLTMLSSASEVMEMTLRPAVKSY
ncbi:MAG: SDR family NAD(P)-dependent oxidoreductase [Rhodopila sp.]